MNPEAVQSIEKIGGADFLIKITYRQNVSLQGEVHWLNTDQKKPFRSFLELVMLMNQCLEESAYPRTDYSPRAWNNPGEAAPKSETHSDVIGPVCKPSRT